MIQSFHRSHAKKPEWVIPEKIHTPTTEGMLENLTVGGSMALEIQTVGGL